MSEIYVHLTNDNVVTITEDDHLIGVKNKEVPQELIDRTVNKEHHDKFPYTNAVLNELASPQGHPDYGLFAFVFQAVGNFDFLYLPERKIAIQCSHIVKISEPQSSKPNRDVKKDISNIKNILG